MARRWLLWAMWRGARLPTLLASPPSPARPRAPRMHVVHHAHLSRQRHGGEWRLVAAGGEQGFTAFEVWVSTLEPGEATAELRQRGQLVVLAQQGGGKLLVDGGPQRFHAPCSLLLPTGCCFQIANNGSTPLQLVWVGAPAPQALDTPPPCESPR